MPTKYTVKRPNELLNVLLDLLPDVKRTKVRQWIKHRCIQINGQIATRESQSVQTGDVLCILSPSEVPPTGLLAKGMHVIHEDSSLIVIEKPENLLSMASDSEREKTAYRYLTNYVRRGNSHSSTRVWIVHRLDRETSGLMVFARSVRVKQVLQEQWYQTRKEYLAIVEGGPTDDEGIFESYLDEQGPFHVFSAPPSPRTRLAVTCYQVIQRFIRKHVRYALVVLRPETGRRNQIRVHLADAGSPIVGDQKYGAKTNPVRRVALHACRLEFYHPESGEPMVFTSKLPSSLQRLLATPYMIT